jgi:hypothetical protein
VSTSTIIQDYIGRGTFAARPATPPVSPGGIAFYFATDTVVLYMWTGAAWVIVGSGTGGSAAPVGASGQFLTTGTTTNASNFASKGNVIVPDAVMSITAVAALITSVTGATYKVGIAPFNTGTNKMTSAPTYSDTFTEVTGVALANIVCKFATPVALAEDTAYIVFLVRTDATSTTSLSMSFGTGPFYSPGLLVPNTGSAFRLASLAPGTGDTWTDDGPGVQAVMLTYTMP